MRDGYYISAYCCIDEEGCCLNAQIRHDQSITLWNVRGKKVTLVKYWELERYTRKKQHIQPFLNKEHFLAVLNDLLKEVHLSAEDIIAIWGMPEFDPSRAEASFAGQFGLPLHSIFHIFSSFIDTKKLFQHTHLVLALDGGPDNVIDRGFDMARHYGAALFDKGKVLAIESISSPAYLWAEASDRFMMREGTLMALADACDCKCEDVSLNIPSFSAMWDIPFLREAFEHSWAIISEKALVLDPRFSEAENRISCFMKIIQKTSREMVENEILRIIRKHGIDPSSTLLSIVGGFALNCPTNTWIMEHFGFQEFLSPPCVNDSGISLGIGLLNFYLEFGSDFEFDFRCAFWGHEESEEAYGAVLEQYGHYIKNISELNTFRLIQDLEEAPICWFEGKSEIGPRALGHRSILSSASSVEMKDRLNRIKQREWWRPVAPMILNSVVEEWFEPPLVSPFMLHAVRIKADKRRLVPAILHLNDTARIQTIDETDLLHSVLTEYYVATGVPMICNTSLNDKGEPIIDTYEELMNFALRKKIRVVYIEKKRVELQHHDDYPETGPCKTFNRFDAFLDSHQSVFEKYADVAIDDEGLDFYVNHRELFEAPILWFPKCRQKEIIQEVKGAICENLSSRNL